MLLNATVGSGVIAEGGVSIHGPAASTIGVAGASAPAAPLVAPLAPSPPKSITFWKRLFSFAFPRRIRIF
jgi:hypothetical protein